MNTAKDVTARVIRKTSDEAISVKWEGAVSSGFTAIPNALIKSQVKLGITSSELNVLLNLLVHWWFKDGLPFPSANTIANRTGMDPRTVQRHLKSLRDKGYIEKVNNGSRKSYSLNGLKDALIKLSGADAWSFFKDVKMT